jgi:hypothetical protein
MNNSTLRGASPATHVKIVLVAVLSALVFLMVGFNARTFNASSMQSRLDAVPVKAQKSPSYARDEARQAIR